MEHNAGEEVKPQTTFPTLFFDLQREILSKLTWKEQKPARLVCRRWCVLINEIGDTRMTINPRRLGRPQTVELLQESCFFKLGKITFRRVKERLPIYSSSRISFPLANEVVLDRGNSQENVLRVLRYYIQYCKILTLKSFCFGSISDAFRLRNPSVFTSITEFTFDVTINDILLDQNPAVAMATFLKHVTFPRLRHLHSNVYAVFMAERFNMLGSAPVALVLTSIDDFLVRHSRTLEGLGYHWFSFGREVYQSLLQVEQCVNLKKLELELQSDPFVGGVPATLAADLTRIVSSLRRLKTLTLILDKDYSRDGPSTTYLLQSTRQVLTTLLDTATAAPKITDLSCKSYDRFDWLQHPAPEINKLTLTGCSTFPPPPAENLLPNLRCLTVEIAGPGIFPPPPPDQVPDWRLTFFPWLAATASTLQILNLVIGSRWYSPPPPSLLNLQALVTNLRRIRRISVKQILPEHRFPDEFPPAPLPALVQEGVDEWLGTFPPYQAQVIKERRQMTIYLSRPLNTD